MTNMNNRFGSKFDRMNSLRRQQHNNDEDENSHPNIVTPANSNDVDDNNDYEDDNDVTTTTATTTTTTTTTTTITPSSSPTDVRRFVEVPPQAALQLCDDIYAPLMPEEADDNQLAEFFTGLDVSPFLNDDDDNDYNNNDQSDQHQQQFNNNTSISTIEQMDVVLCHGTKRRKLSHDEQVADSSVSLCSSSSASAYTVDTYNDEDDETKFVLPRKQQLFVRE
ncbi:hypothetical protein FRACYDRAFT_259364 [Fragilariopsis cylindrus CCMP1102]|uniref:Uncharacterized protein n=1 Tax=Fragilariopsis cylindrus CCMP1102 TaxID=635003 RepID=A0A1E7FYV8_9STRA|nr:hypothetical protein FRACYDRAFT_259364 [Fragilariopsis cylindrus CCMP1102]|eukprot:OEU23337.1 hypothetical protein FRACYDRAFT_259364 [Fragilariopsis cylindrus CCMP1102]